jgi:uncharacterized protein YyaL (SSP411 family)
MIAALAKCGRALGEESYVKAAEEAAGFVLKGMMPGGRLRHAYDPGRGTTMVMANADDYAMLVWGLTELGQALPEEGYIDTALELQDEMLALFLDNEAGGFSTTTALCLPPTPWQ